MGLTGLAAADSKIILTVHDNGPLYMTRQQVGILFCRVSLPSIENWAV